jgi:hypothetical protein
MSLVCGLAFALGVYLGRQLSRLGDWIEDVVWRLFSE